jgi:cytochrome c oxidase subunit II
MGPASSSAKVVNDVIFYFVGICVFLLSLITFLMVYFVTRYRKNRHPRAEQIEGNIWLELTWTVAPTLLVLAMFYYGWTGFDFLKKIPKGSMVVKVTARQWSWLFEYPNGVKDTELRVPVAKPIELQLSSVDVIHGFYVPAFRIKQDAVPGMKTHLWFEPTETGTFDILCSQYCGLQHAHMLSQVIVLSKEEFEKWYEGKQLEMASVKGPALGLQLYKEKGCIACHSLDGAIRVGPSFKGLYGKGVKVITGGKEHTLVADDAYLQRSVMDPNVDVVEGFLPNLMPKPDLAPQQMDELIAFIKSVK